MPRKKRRRILELPAFPNVFENPTNMKGRWKHACFDNSYPVTLELACGKGEYAIALARRFPRRNFIGVDIKGARLWKGARLALEQELHNVVFLRSRIEHLERFFDEGELDEIWITFPDPYPRERKANKRLTSPEFVAMYRRILRPAGDVHLKTDDANLFDYTLKVLKSEGCIVHDALDDVYENPGGDGLLLIKTTYERKHLEKGRKIKYVRFSP